MTQNQLETYDPCCMQLFYCHLLLHYQSMSCVDLKVSTSSNNNSQEVSWVVKLYNKKLESWEHVPWIGVGWWHLELDVERVHFCQHVHDKGGWGSLWLGYKTWVLCFKCACLMTSTSLLMVVGVVICVKEWLSPSTWWGWDVY